MRLKDGYGTKMSQHLVPELNNGFIKMLTITQALIKDTPIMILEEPTNGLSPAEFDQLVRIMPSFRYRLNKSQKSNLYNKKFNTLSIKKIIKDLIGSSLSRD